MPAATELLLRDLLFAACAGAIVVGELFITRSAIRGMRSAGATRSAWEWAWVAIPAVALGLTLWAAWGALHPPSVVFTLPGGTA
jgi:hypothetical protein